MLVELQLDTDRFNPADRGYSVDIIGREARELAQAVTVAGPPPYTYDLPACESNTGYVMLQPDLDFDSEELTFFADLSSDETWEQIEDVWFFGGRGLHHRKAELSQAITAADLEVNQATIVGLMLAKPPTGETQKVLLYWGVDGEGVPALTLQLEPGKRPAVALLCEETGEVFAFELDDVVLSEADLYGKPISIYVMPLRQRLVIHSNLWGDWYIRPPWGEKPSYEDGDTHYYCVRAGKFQLDITAIFYLAFRAMTYATDAAFDVPFTLPYAEEGEEAPTQMPTTSLDWEVFSGCGAVLSVLGPEGDAYEIGDKSGVIRVILTGDGDHTPILNKLVVRWPPTAAFVEGNPVAPHLLEAEECLSADPGADSWRFTIRPGEGEATLWQRPNLPFTVTVDEDTVRMVGLADTPTRLSDGAQRKYELTLRSGIKRLEHALIARSPCDAVKGPESYDGMLLTDVITRLLQLAGVDDSEIDVDPGGELDTTLPCAEDGKDPLYRFDGGCTVLQAITQLRDEWASDWLFYHDSDGFHFVPRPDATPVATFEQAGDPDADNLLTDLRVWSDDTEFCNWLIVAGQDDDGNAILSDLVEDTASINDPESANYVGELRQVILLNSSANTVDKCNEIALQAWGHWNTIPRFVSWKGPFLKDLRPHQVVQVRDDDGEYLTVRLTEMRTSFVPNLSETDYAGMIEA